MARYDRSIGVKWWLVEIVDGGSIIDSDPVSLYQSFLFKNSCRRTGCVWNHFNETCLKDNLHAFRGQDLYKDGSETSSESVSVT